MSSERSAVFWGRGAGRAVQAVPGIERTTRAHGEKTLLAEFRLGKGSRLPRHAHPEEQIGTLVSGRMVLTIGDDRYEVLPGDSWCIPGGVEHEAEILEESVALEVFSPVRKDFLPPAGAAEE